MKFRNKKKQMTLGLAVNPTPNAALSTVQLFKFQKPINVTAINEKK